VQLHVLAAAAAAALPVHGTVVPGVSLGGLQLGDSPERVLAVWGHRLGVCRGCRQPTWYYNYAAYEPQGAGVEFRGRRVIALFTLWSPTGWRTSQGVRAGDPATRIAAVYGPLTRLSCGAYDAYLLPRGRTTTVIYAVGEQVWGFALSRRSLPVCR
jgi:hypothetical protein